MARKRLIKGANATRVEERIARVPEDIEAETNIFRALKALEVSQPAENIATPPLSVPAAAKPARQLAAKPEPSAKPKRTPKPKRAARQDGPGPAERGVEVKAEPAERAATEIYDAANGAARIRKIGPSDFNAAERQAIVRCCTDYRNRLPIYLLAVQPEVETIDSIIEKCRQADEGTKRG